MTYSLGSRRWRFVSVFASVVMLVGANAAAQTPPPTPEPPPVLAPPPEPPQPAPSPGIPEPTPIYPQMKGREITLGEGTWIRFGLQTQTWLDIAQSSVREANGEQGDYSFNLFERRLRLFSGVQAFRRLQIFVLIEGSNLGRGSGVAAASGFDNKNFSSIALLDGWAELQFHDYFYLEAGLMLVPLARNILQATTTYLSLDVGSTSATLLSLGTTVLRDVGIEAKGYLLDDHLEYRLGVFGGLRDLPTMTQIGSKNSPRVAGFLQYNALDVDKGYVFQGTYYGRKNIAGVAAGFDFQKGTDADPYWAASASVFAAIPLNGNPKEGGDEVAGFIQYIHFDGGETVPVVPAFVALRAQNDILV